MNVQHMHVHVQVHEHIVSCTVHDFFVKRNSSSNLRIVAFALLVGVVPLSSLEGLHISGRVEIHPHHGNRLGKIRLGIFKVHGDLV